MGKPKVSLIIRTFNEEKHIGKLLSEISLQKTSFTYEVIIVDSGSNDNTLDILENFNVRLLKINPEEFTFGRSLNIGIKEALGEYCIMTSAHCYPVHKHWIENLVKPFKNQNCAIVYGKQMGIDETKYSEQQIFAQWFPEFSNNKTNLPFCNNANSAIRKSDWETRKFDEELTGLEDLDYAKYFHSKKKDIAYQADASAYHIHDETPKQVMNRYYREALAYKSIYNNETFYFTDFLKFFCMNVAGDYLHSLQDGVFFKNIFEIPQFRFLQFWGTYKAHQSNKPISKDMQKRIFYPKKTVLFRQKKVAPPQNFSHSFIDISHPLSDKMPVWPGSKPFSITHIKDHDTDNLKESEVTFNLHTSTHIDAPEHFLKDGSDVTEICLNQLNGKALILECLDRKVIDVDFFTNINMPKNTTRVLLKTLNSITYAPGVSFDKKFVAITSNAAKWLIEHQVNVIGIDGPSIQLFDDPTNETHEVLLQSKVIIIEGLNLKHTEKGVRKLICMPLKIPHAEGVPARAVLLEGTF